MRLLEDDQVIGRRCKRGDLFSLPVLIVERLDHIPTRDLSIRTGELRALPLAHTRFFLMHPESARCGGEEGKRIPGAHTQLEIPVPIPNTAVKQLGPMIVERRK